MNVPIFSLLPIAAAVHHPRSSSGDECQRIARWLQPTPERRRSQFLHVLRGARGVSQPRTMRTWCILLSSASGIGMPSPMGAAPSSAIDEPHAPRPVGSRQRCRSASSDSGRRNPRIDETEGRIGNHVDPWRWRPLPLAQDRHLLAAIRAEAAETVEELEVRKALGADGLRRRLSSIFPRLIGEITVRTRLLPESDAYPKIHGSNCQSPRAQRCWRAAASS
jgi:hypothetical protein